jgi:hypothetical protein
MILLPQKTGGQCPPYPEQRKQIVNNPTGRYLQIYGCMCDVEIYKKSRVGNARLTDPPGTNLFSHFAAGWALPTGISTLYPFRRAVLSLHHIQQGILYY